MQISQEQGAGISDSSAGSVPRSGVPSNVHRGAAAADYPNSISDALANTTQQQGTCPTSLRNSSWPWKAGASAPRSFNNKLTFQL